MATDGRGTGEIRTEIGAEREQLAGAVEDLRRDIRATARKLPAIAGGALAVGIALGAARAALRRRRR